MKIDASKSKFHEHPDAREDFTRAELTLLRFLLRRLRFLEHNATRRAETDATSVFTEREMDALEFVLIDIGFLPDDKPVSRNRRSKRP